MPDCEGKPCFIQSRRVRIDHDPKYHDSNGNQDKNWGEGTPSAVDACEKAVAALREKWVQLLKTREPHVKKCDNADPPACHCAYEATPTHTQQAYRDEQIQAKVMTGDSGTVTVKVKVVVDYLTLHGECQEAIPGHTPEPTPAPSFTHD